MSSAPPAYSEKGGPPMSLHDWLKGLDCGVYAKRFAGTSLLHALQDNVNNFPSLRNSLKLLTQLPYVALFNIYRSDHPCSKRNKYHHRCNGIDRRHDEVNGRGMFTFE